MNNPMAAHEQLFILDPPRTDRGSHYASEDFRTVLDKHGMRASMSRKSTVGTTP